MAYGTSIQAADAAANKAMAAGIPFGPAIPFYRIGEPIIILVSPTSAGNRVGVQVPAGATAFQYVNNNPFAVRLCGTRSGGDFKQVTAETGWLWLPLEKGIRTSLVPAFVSAMSVDSWSATGSKMKAGTGFIELQYGTGGVSS